MAPRERGLSPANEQALTTSRAVVNAMENRPRGNYTKHQAVAAWGCHAELLPALSLQANWAMQFPLANWAIVVLAL